MVALVSLTLSGCSDDPASPTGGGDAIVRAKVGSSYIYGFQILDADGNVDPGSTYYGDTTATIAAVDVPRDTMSTVSVIYDCDDSTYVVIKSDGGIAYRRQWGSTYDHVESGAWIHFPGTIGASRTDTVLREVAFLTKTIVATSKRESDTTIVVGTESISCRRFSTHLAIRYQGGAAYNLGQCDVVLYVAPKLGYIVREHYLRGGKNSSGNPYEGGYIKTLRSYVLVN